MDALYKSTYKLWVIFPVISIIGVLRSHFPTLANEQSSSRLIYIDIVPPLSSLATYQFQTYNNSTISILGNILVLQYVLLSVNCDIDKDYINFSS